MKRALFLVMLAACTPERPPTDETPTQSPSSTGDDAGSALASVIDAGHGIPDAAVPDSAITRDAAVPPDAAATTEEDAGAPDAGSRIGERCFADIFDPTVASPDYDQYHPVIGRHCNGTNHQRIEDVERVVFIGDSVTVGTPPSLPGQVYRSILSDRLAEQFGLEAPGLVWKTANVLTGESTLRVDGDFASCAKWGARTDDFLEDGTQLADCFPESERSKRTLVIFTIGGNDIAALTKDGAHRSYEENFTQASEFIALLREAVHWFKDDPARFPNGVDVVFANMFEFTDGTGDMASCPAASAAGFTEVWDRPEELERLVIWANEQFMQIAVETQSDMVFMLENFCGHGYYNEDPSTRCYRGPNTERWFDLTCIHPTPTGHEALAELMFSVIVE